MRNLTTRIQFNEDMEAFMNRMLTKNLYPQFSAPMWFWTWVTISSQLWTVFSGSVDHPYSFASLTLSPIHRKKDLRYCGVKKIFVKKSKQNAFLHCLCLVRVGANARLSYTCSYLGEPPGASTSWGYIQHSRRCPPGPKSHPRINN